MLETALKRMKEFEAREKDLEERAAEAAFLRTKVVDLQAEADATKAAQQAAEEAKAAAEEASQEARLARAMEKFMVYTEAMPKRKPREDDDDDAQASKKPKTDKREFFLNGEKVTPAPYERMMMEELLNPGSVDPRCREKVARDEFFELHHLYNVDDLETANAKQSREEGAAVVPFQSGSTPKGAPRSRSELFQLLYSFGQYYLQCYPQKACGFLEYLAYISKYGQTYTVSTLVKLDNSIRRFFIHRPHLNWDVTRREIGRFEKDAEIFQEKELSARTGRTPSKGRGGGGHHGSPHQSHQSRTPKRSASHDNGFRNDRRGDSSRRDPGSSSADPRDSRCRNWNYRTCEDDPRCHREHVCYKCGATGHKAPDCPKFPPGSRKRRR